MIAVLAPDPILHDMLMRATVDAALLQARVDRRPVLVNDQTGHSEPFRYDWHIEPLTLAELIEESDAGQLIAYPTAALIPAHAIHTIWLTPTRPFLATGVQMVEACRRLRVRTDAVYPAEECRMVGTCLACCSDDDWWLVQPQTLPAFAGL